MVDPTLHDTIEKYLLHQLSPEENARLEAAMATDVALLEQVEIQRLAMSGMLRLSGAELSENFSRWDAQLPPLPPVAGSQAAVRGLKINHWAWATAILLLFLIAGAWWHFVQMARAQADESALALSRASADSLRMQIDRLQTRLADPEAAAKDTTSQAEIRRLRAELEEKERLLRQSRPRANRPIAMRYAPAPPALNLRGGDGSETPDKVLAEAEASFRAGKYTEAVALLRGIPAGDVRQAQVTRALPYALFYANDFQAAAPAFLKLWENDRFEAETAQFYLLLCYLGTGQNDAARAMRLMILANPQHRFFDAARGLAIDG